MSTEQFCLRADLTGISFLTVRADTRIRDLQCEAICWGDVTYAKADSRHDSAQEDHASGSGTDTLRSKVRWIQRAIDGPMQALVLYIFLSVSYREAVSLTVPIPWENGPNSVILFGFFGSSSLVRPSVPRRGVRPVAYCRRGRRMAGKRKPKNAKQPHQL